MIKRVVRSGTKLVYGKIAKPVLFKQHPDDVHRRLLQAGRVVQSAPGVKQLPKLWAHGNKHVLGQTVFGIQFDNPVGLSAGFDKNIQLPGLLKSVGFGFMTGGSITFEQCDGNPGPWFYRLKKSKSLVVYAGLPNHGAKLIVSRLDKRTKNVFNNFPLIVSVAKTNSVDAATDDEAIKDYVGTFKLLEKSATPAMYELNISCPNTHGGQPFTTPERLERLLSEVDSLKLKRPLTVKMPISLEWKDFERLLDVIARHGVQGVTIGNLLKREKAALKDELPAEVKGSLSGAPTRDVSTELIRKTYHKYGDKLVIIGVGGIFGARDAYEKIKAGATMVELITGMIFEGPQLIGMINCDLEQLLIQDGYENVSQAVGADER